MMHSWRQNRCFRADNLVALIESPTKLTESQSNDLISFSKVDIISPSQKLLARKLTCDILPGKSLLVTGPNGSGKSSIFRVLRSLWPIVRGRLVKPHQQLDEDTGYGCGVFYIPQRPYTCLGTLRDQVIYPLSLEEAEQRTLPSYREGWSSNNTDGNAAK
ncbi:ABC transporter D family member 1 [Camellia lanceoleosa]|nr:ABC transporter D family member 1 [Camellia lanceoleosa]